MLRRLDIYIRPFFSRRICANHFLRDVSKEDTQRLSSFRCFSTTRDEQVEAAEGSSSNLYDITPWTLQEVEELFEAVEKHGRRWTYISKNHFHSKRPASELKRKWIDHQNIKDNVPYHNYWTAEEDEKLRKGVEDFGTGKWKKIQENFLPNKSENQIVNRWLIISKTKRGKWNKEEDQIMLDFIESNGKKWNEVSHILGRPSADVYRRYHLIIRKPWTEHEKKMLFDSIKTYGYDWTKIMTNFPDRKLVEVKQYHNFHPATNPNVKVGRWTLDEVERLKRSIEVNGKKWLLVAKDVGSRTNCQCQAYWRNHIQKSDEKAYRLVQIE
ncbi:11107_t:CDS:1 [Acaulospora colombiana]|uniref:11107_t:CDS:1 n=1 Tax=Acaulospora colombiana TaxID=27376 RepID=A0ACA9KEV5_9GLOM|nr:11107_t:CDS:1 [Acaulospora colombiana]